MTVANSVFMGASASTNRATTMDIVRQPPTDSYQVPNPDVSGLERANNAALDVGESSTFNYGVMGAAAAYGAGSAAVAASSAGVAAAGTAALASLGTFAVVAGAGLAGAYVGSKVGAAVADLVFGSIMGKKKIATDGDTPAYLGHPIAHVNKNAGLWGAIVGCVAAVAVGVLIVATCGTGLLVLAAAAAVGGLIAGGITAFASTAGQYGANKGSITQGSPNVFFEGKPVARVGDLIVCSDHSGVQKLAEGAKTVFANNKNIVRTGHRTTCDANVNDGCKTINETKETSTVLEIKDSRSPWLRWANIIVNLALVVDGMRGGPKERLPEGELSTAGEGCATGKCTTAGEPVDVGTGDFIQAWPLIALPGSIPLRLGRLYRSTARFRGVLGAGWADDWSQHLVLDEQTVTYHTAEGTTLVYHTPRDDVKAVNLREGRYSLSGQRSGVLRLYDRQTRCVLSFSHAPDARTRRLSDIEDLNGNRIRFDYHDGALAGIQHSDGYELAVRQTQGRIEAVHLRNGYDDIALLRCAYDTHGRLTECASYQFGTLFHVYDNAGHMIEWGDTRHTRATIEYDERGRVLATRTASGHYQDRFDYDDTAHCTHYHDAEGGRSTYYTNADGLVIRQIDPLGHSWLTEWDELTNKVAQTDPLGRTTRYRSNAFGEVIAVELPDGAHQSYRYDARGCVSEVIRRDGARWQYSHDPRGNLTGVRDPYDHFTGYRLGERGEVLRRDNPDGSQWRFAYDGTLRLCEVIGPDGHVSRLQKDVFGRVLRVEDALHQVTRYDYEAGHAHPRGSVSEVILPDGTQQSMRYDSEHLLVAATNGEGHTTQYRYGAFDLLESVASPGGQGLHLAYDKLTRLTAVTNGEKETYRYAYDAAGRCIRETDYGDATTGYTYNAAGWLTDKRGADGSHTVYEHDPASGRLQRLVRTSRQPGRDVPLVEETRFAYNDTGYLREVANRDAVIEYERDPYGRLLAERLNGREVAYRYDLLTGRPRGLDAGQSMDWTLDWSWDVNGALTQLGIGGHAPLTITRDALGRDTRRHSAAGFTLQQGFDPLGLLTAQQAGPSEQKVLDDLLADPRASHATLEGLVGLPGGAPVQRQYRYDRAFNPVQIDDRRWGSSSYRYDANGQVSGVQLDATARHPALTEGYSYDGAHNLVCRTLSNLPGVERHDLNLKAGRVVSIGRSQYHYDTLGRLEEKLEQRDGFRTRRWRYRWNGDNRLVELITPEGERWRYAYDGLGRRIRKFKLLPGGRVPEIGGATVGEAPEPLELADQPTTPTPSGRGTIGGGPRGKVTVIGENYLWSGDQLIEAAPIYADGTVAYDKATCWAYAPGGFTPLAQSKGGRLWYVVSDHLGTPRELLAETGELAWSNSPATWGEQRLWRRPAANDDAVDCPIRFPGQYRDDESGLHYNRHRYYDPETAQYLSPDPLGLAGGLRPQGYVDNPNTWFDPLGLVGCPVEKYEIGTFDDLSKRSRVGDELDIHHAVQKHPAGQVIPGYDPKTAPSIALPRNEHTQIPTTRGEYDGSARDLLAKDIQDLRNNTNAPNSALQKLIELNKNMYPISFSK